MITIEEILPAIVNLSMYFNRLKPQRIITVAFWRVDIFLTSSLVFVEQEIDGVPLSSLGFCLVESKDESPVYTLKTEAFSSIVFSEIDPSLSIFGCLICFHLRPKMLRRMRIATVCNYQFSGGNQRSNFGFLPAVSDSFHSARELVRLRLSNPLEIYL